MKIRVVAGCALLTCLLSMGDVATAQAPPPAPNAAPKPAKQAAVIDLTGYWVSIVNEDWRWRMMTPPKGDYASVPLNPAGKQEADKWDLSQDGSCRAYGAAGLLRMPTRLHITWESDDVLKIESDWGQQTRHLYFRSADLPAAEQKTLQGRSLASWQHPLAPTGGMGLPAPTVVLPGGSLKVVTNALTPGWLRRNGVPYSENAALTEYFDRFPTPDGNEWFVVTTIVDDPKFLAQQFVTSSQFRREPDASKWTPRPCKQ
jgi:hypothetical protein